MEIKNESGISLMTVIITIVVMIILASIAISSSFRMIGDAGEAKKQAETYEDREIIRALLINSVPYSNDIVGFPLGGAVIVLGSGDKEYGSGYYLVPGGESEDEDGDLATLRFKLGDNTLQAYKGLTAPYVVDYDNGKYERVEEIRFK
jgi:type II secretory pathway pseudopilin PulG